MLKLEPPAERTKTAVSEWIAGGSRVPPETEKENLIVTILNKYIMKAALQKALASESNLCLILRCMKCMLGDHPLILEALERSLGLTS